MEGWVKGWVQGWVDVNSRVGHGSMLGRGAAILGMGLPY